MKNPYKVMLIKDDKIIHESLWIMADDQKTAERVVIAANHSLYGEEVRVVSRPFCE